MRILPYTLLVFAGHVACFAQAAPPAPASSEVQQLRQELEETKAKLADSVEQIQALRRDMEELRSRMQPLVAPAAAAPAATSPDVASEPTAAAADQDPSFLAAKVRDLHQVKVESESRYPVKISGLVLFNAYHNTGFVDIEDLPNLAFGGAKGSSDGSIGATLRQTLLGLEVRGPHVLGAETSADASVDFAGGSPTTNYGVTAGILRLRTANLRLDWKNTTLNVGQDSPFISPLSPTSYATLAEPALAWAGNLWVWTPQIMLEHRIQTGDESRVIVQGGVMDPLTEEVPPFQGRIATAGERSGAPSVAGRITFDRLQGKTLPFTIGVAGSRGRQRYQNFPMIDSWTVDTDFKFRFGQKAELSGEWYTGQAVGGLGGGIWTSAIFNGVARSSVAPLRSTGGWAQLKITPRLRYEWNLAIGQDANFSKQAKVFAAPINWTGFPPLQKNQAEIVNFVFKPTSVLLFAVEYRHLLTAPLFGPSKTGEHVNLAVGVRF